MLTLASRPPTALHLQHGVMNLPGLGLEEPEEVQKAEITQHELAKDCEWRFEVAVGKFVKVKVGQRHHRAISRTKILRTGPDWHS